MPACTPTITSGTVDMPTTSAPMPRRKRYSARVSRFGPGTATKTPLWHTIFSSRAIRWASSSSSTIIRLAHVGKARAEAIVVLADERIVAHEVDVVLDQHDVALGPLRVHAAAGVADDQDVAAHRLHDADGEGDLLEGVAFVEMEAPFHRHDRLAAERAAHQPARVGFDGRVRGSGEFPGYGIFTAFWISSASPPSPVPRMMPTRRLSRSSRFATPSSLPGFDRRVP